MALTPEALGLSLSRVECAWAARDAQLYALAVGMGRDPCDRTELLYVADDAPRCLPSMATVIAWPANLGAAALGVDARQILHGEQSVTLHRPLPPAGRLFADSRVTGAGDKGPGGAAIVFIETLLSDPLTKEIVAVLRRATYVRGGGGFGGERVPRAAWQAPARRPDWSISVSTLPEQALIYRLCGDANPLHWDPDLARSLGYERPILHGLCTFGIACVALTRTYAGGEAAPLRHLQARFAGPLYPGETLAFDIWRDGPELRFRARAADRGAPVLTAGLARFDADRRGGGLRIEE